MTKKILGLRHIVTGGVVLLATGLGTAGVASAATTHRTSSTPLTITSLSSSHDAAGDTNREPLGPGDTPLTGATLTSADNAAVAAVPNSTVVRAESDARRGAYVVLVKKSDGSYDTVIENSSFTVTSVSSGRGPRPEGSMGDPAAAAHGPGETVLTGTDLTDAVKAATAAVPNSTVVRAESDAQGSAFEVHVKKADGTYATVKEDASFTVTSVQSGFGAGAPKGAGRMDAASRDH